MARVTLSPCSGASTVGPRRASLGTRGLACASSQKCCLVHKSIWTSLRPAFFAAFWSKSIQHRHRERGSVGLVIKTVPRCLSLRQRANQMSDSYFCVFWAEKNAERKAQGAQVLNFREARREFGCHATPPG